MFTLFLPSAEFPRSFVLRDGVAHGSQFYVMEPLGLDVDISQQGMNLQQQCLGLVLDFKIVTR